MRKSVLKVSAMLMMLLSVSFSMQSCGLFDDVFDTPVEDTTTPSTPAEPEDDKVVTEATVEDFADITAALNDAKDEIEASAKSGGEYEIAIKSEESLETTTSDNTIEVPRVEDSNINLNFTNGVSSTQQTLTVKAADAKSETPTEAVNKLTITMPASKGLNLELDMPETTVTLKAASGEVVYEEVVATTALNTLYIEKGVTVKNLQVKGGSVVVNGGAAETFVYAAADNDDELIVYNDSITIGGLWTSDKKDIEERTLIKGYRVNNLKIIKGDADYANIFLFRGNSLLEKLTIAEGVVVRSIGNEPMVRIIEGEGEGAEFSVEYDPQPHLQLVREVKGVTLSGFPNNALMDMIRGNYDNCIFTSTKVEFEAASSTGSAVTTTGSTVKNSRFEGTTISFSVPRQSENIPSCKFSFTDCDFSQGLKLETALIDWEYVYDENGERIWDEDIHYWWYYDRDQQRHKVNDKSEIPDDAISRGETIGDYKTTDTKYEDYDVVIILDKCTMGGSSLPAPAEFITKPEKIPAGMNLKFVIDSKTYQFVEGSLEVVQ